MGYNWLECRFLVFQCDQYDCFVHLDHDFDPRVALSVYPKLTIFRKWVTELVGVSFLVLRYDRYDCFVYLDHGFDPRVCSFGLPKINNFLEMGYRTGRNVVSCFSNMINMVVLCT